MKQYIKYNPETYQVTEYAPRNKGGILNYNSLNNHEMLIADGYSFEAVENGYLAGHAPQKPVEAIRQELIDYNLQTKRDWAYSGMQMNIEGDYITFATDENSRTNWAFIIAGITPQTVRSFKVYPENGLPYDILLEAPALLYIHKEMGYFIDRCFAKEGERNRILYDASEESLRDPVWVETYKEETLNQMQAINKILDYNVIKTLNTKGDSNNVNQV